MALIVTHSDNFIQVALDGATDFDMMADLVAYGMDRNPTGNIRIRKITFIPSATGDTMLVRDTENGPIMFAAINSLGTYDVQKDEYRDDSNVDKGKLCQPFLDATDQTVSVPNQAYVIFEL